ncbi:MAG: histidine triad nucleotide-binding protein [Halanaerobiales bacterium]|nr:histidine triad nucleotide-binding protein [Halanaerobiales bacterium]
MVDCLFCKIVNKKDDSDLVYQDEKVIVFKDINPQAPVHLLLVSKEHFENILDLEENQFDIIGHIHQVAVKMAKKFNLDEDGFRLVNNTKQKAGQTVFHIHFHLLGGREMQWPPG